MTAPQAPGQPALPRGDGNESDLSYFFGGTVRLSSATRSHVRDGDGGRRDFFAFFPRRQQAIGL